MGFGAESHSGPERDPPWFELFTNAEVRDGYVHLNGKPGFGVEINWEFVKRHRA